MHLSGIHVRHGALGAVAAALVLATIAAPASATTPTPAPGYVPGVASIGNGATPHALRVFYRSSANRLVGKLSGTTEDLGGALSSGPAAVTSSPTEFVRLSVYVRGTDNRIWRRDWSDGAGEWGPWRSEGGRALGAPGATCVGPPGSAARLYVRGGDDALWRKIGGGAWTRLGGRLGADPAPVPSAAVGCAAAEEVFVRGDNSRVYWWTPSRGFIGIGGLTHHSPAALRLADGEVDAFARGTDDALYMNRRLPGSSTWTGWARILDGPLASPPTATTLTPDGGGAQTRRVFFQLPDGKLYGAANAVGSGTWSVAEIP